MHVDCWCRLAMQAGAPIVPVFAFGQTPHYSYWRPFIDWPKRLIPAGSMGRQARRPFGASHEGVSAVAVQSCR